MVSGTLPGFVEVELDSGLVIPDIKVFDGAYVALPDKPAMRQGELQRGNDGKALYMPLLKWRDRATADKFSASVIRLLRQRYPTSLTATAAASPREVLG